MKICQQHLNALIEPETRVVMATVFNVTSSSLRDQGARMLELRDRAIDLLNICEKPSTFAMVKKAHLQGKHKYLHSV